MTMTKLFLYLAQESMHTCVKYEDPMINHVGWRGIYKIKEKWLPVKDIGHIDLIFLYDHNWPELSTDDTNNDDNDDKTRRMIHDCIIFGIYAKNYFQFIYWKPLRYLPTF